MTRLSLARAAAAGTGLVVDAARGERVAQPVGVAERPTMSGTANARGLMVSPRARWASRTSSASPSTTGHAADRQARASARPARGRRAGCAAVGSTRTTTSTRSVVRVVSVTSAASSTSASSTPTTTTARSQPVDEDWKTAERRRAPTPAVGAGRAARAAAARRRRTATTTSTRAAATCHGGPTSTRDGAGDDQQQQLRRRPGIRWSERGARAGTSPSVVLMPSARGSG